MKTPEDFKEVLSEATKGYVTPLDVTLLEMYLFRKEVSNFDLVVALQKISGEVGVVDMLQHMGLKKLEDMTSLRREVFLHLTLLSKDELTVADEAFEVYSRLEACARTRLGAFLSGVMRACGDTVSVEQVRATILPTHTVGISVMED